MRLWLLLVFFFLYAPLAALVAGCALVTVSAAQLRDRRHQKISNRNGHEPKAHDRAFHRRRGLRDLSVDGANDAVLMAAPLLAGMAAVAAGLVHAIYIPSYAPMIPVLVVACLHGLRPLGPPVAVTSYYGSIYPSVQTLLLAARAGTCAELVDGP